MPMALVTMDITGMNVMKSLIAAAFLMISTYATAEPVDAAKLKLLSCLHNDPPSSAKRAALDWMNKLPSSVRDGPAEIAGPLWLHGACMKNVTVVAAFGAFFVQGEICNKKLSDFTAPLSAMGLMLQKDVVVMERKALLGAASKDYEYSIMKGRMDLATGKITQGAHEFSFFCSLKGSGPQ